MQHCIFNGYFPPFFQARLLKLVHYMGGSVRNEIKETVTHIVAHASTGRKYEYAATFNIPVMGEEWVHTAWAHRDEVGSRADTEAMVRLSFWFVSNCFFFIFFMNWDTERAQCALSRVTIPKKRKRKQ